MTKLSALHRSTGPHFLEGRWQRRESALWPCHGLCPLPPQAGRAGVSPPRRELLPPPLPHLPDASVYFQGGAGPTQVTLDPSCSESVLTGPLIPSARSLGGSAQGGVCMPGAGGGRLVAYSEPRSSHGPSRWSHVTRPLCVWPSCRARVPESHLAAARLGSSAVCVPSSVPWHGHLTVGLSGRFWRVSWCFINLGDSK